MLVMAKESRVDRKLPLFVLFMLVMSKRSRGDLKRLFYMIQVVFTFFCFIHVGNAKEHY
ncbi:uncharacterized protein BX664DRAFT_349096 [Halteromyces radiatus]|uniref:uncharacterized protein n=1 Tax=Halteromyces radiatus TaxID=101107 RepID=UPI00221F507C|nr:uncharacterized protein BX664DRAFT_353961 [Halteromyces radiatus]XP_051402376.1 uncharacterized protein BX664DRAFT_349096 [Halteromyces radiatus]KAI8076374.1 hypothetical protein BX664DRAFT_353961 [Halteromyces radiatus]KAI8093925.1 hypothetical protein BX664DRAFT_349096 [Halteromyces radiatus]